MPKLPWIAEEWVAVVDDDESVRRSLERFFRIAGVRVRTFAVAEEFLNEVGVPPACVVIDVQLGTSTGFELRDSLEARSVPPPPIIFITARDDLAALGRSDERGVCAWLAKPFRAETLLSIIDDMRAARREWITSVGDTRNTA